MLKADGEQDWIGEKRLLMLGLATLAKILEMKLSGSLKCYSCYFSDYTTPKSTWANLDWQETRASSHVLALFRLVQVTTVVPPDTGD